ncbi:MAG TPA: tRNA (adenosine(37)-N6)-threonylcarbamoyltransferase complex dimerization subunit type 1 TsaB [Gemmatimonadales bacterium]|nr:tRNA (adenosine(37)-N6)-threonylcarbamoyltransferase complex dimerization subunit type 1 TsaB [Gemmatimonadales bacterium]
MTLWLALDTATAVGSVALGPPGEVIVETTIVGRRQAAGLLPSIDHLLKQMGRGYGDVAGIVVADGPGSFTGLRVGFATAQGLLRQLEDRSFGRAPALMSAAWVGSRFCDGPVAAVFDALRGEVFAAVYGFGPDGVEVLLRPTLTTPAALVERAVPAALAVGDGAVRYGDAMAAWTGRSPVGPPWGGQRAGALIELLRVPGAVESLERPFEVEPTYGRAAAAQSRWEERHGRPLPDTPGNAR